MVWCRDIVDDLEKVSASKMDLTDFVNKHWEKFKPVYIHFHKHCADEADLYLLVHEFFSKILRADVQPLFLSDNQLYNYFKTAVRNKHYDNTHKKEVILVPFTDLTTEQNEYADSYEDTIEEECIPQSELIESEMCVDDILNELSKVLPEHCMKLLILVYKDGLTPQEARKELGVNITTIRDRMIIIRDAVRKNEEINNILKNKEL